MLAGGGVMLAAKLALLGVSALVLIAYAIVIPRLLRNQRQRDRAAAIARYNANVAAYHEQARVARIVDTFARAYLNERVA